MKSEFNPFGVASSPVPVKLKLFTFNISPTFPSVPAVGLHESSPVPSALASGHENVFLSGEKKQKSGKKSRLRALCDIPFH